MMTDSIADMLTRIRNANRIERPAVDMPASRLKINVAQVLKEEGFIYDYQIGLLVKDEDGVKQWQQESDLSKPKVLLRVFLKYGPEGERVIRHIERSSRPGRRLYVGSKELRPVLDGLGISIALPRIRDFRGVNPKSFDGHGNYSLGLAEQSVFPEIDPDKVTFVQGMDITFVTSTNNDDEARELLRSFGMPFREA